VTTNKRFKLEATEIKQLVAGLGACLATDRIVVDGAAVGYMYREKPKNESDSGWRFFAGDEDEQYMSNPALHGVYAVNTIANYDPDIIPFLRAPAGSQFERDAAGKLAPISAD
jgi:hypothetical protein